MKILQPQTIKNSDLLFDFYKTNIVLLSILAKVAVLKENCSIRKF